MIEQIFTYFTIETLYMWINLGILPFWFILIIIISVSIFGLLVFVFVKNYIRNKINRLLEDKNKKD